MSAFDPKRANIASQAKEILGADELQATGGMCTIRSATE
jgi:hypothetical protein